MNDLAPALLPGTPDHAPSAPIRAGFTPTVAARASVFLRDPHIAEEIKAALLARAKRTEITADRVLKEIARIAFLDTRSLVSWDQDGVTVVPSSELSDDDAAAVASAEVVFSGDGDRVVRVKPHDKMDALKLLMKHLGLSGTIRVQVDGGGSAQDLLASIAGDEDPAVREE